MSYPKNDRRSSKQLQSPRSYFGKVLDGIVDRRGTSVSEVERKCGISQAHLSRLRHGGHGITFNLLARLEKGVPLTEAEVISLMVASMNDARDRLDKGDEK